MPPASMKRASRCWTAAIRSTSARRRRLYCDCEGRCGNQPGRILATKPRNWRSEEIPIAAWQTARATSSASATSGRRPRRAGTGYSSAKTYAATTRASRSVVISSLHLEGHVWKPSFALHRRVPARNPPFHIKPLVRRWFGQRQRLHPEERLKVGLVPQHISKRRVGFLACQKQVAEAEVPAADLGVDEREPRHRRRTLMTTSRRHVA